MSASASEFREKSLVKIILVFKVVILFWANQTVWSLINVPSLATTVFLPKDPSVSPFYDPYVEAILHMDTITLMKIPVMNDDEFMLKLTKGVDNMTGLLTQNPIFDDKLHNQLVSQRIIERQWEELVTSTPMTIILFFQALATQAQSTQRVVVYKFVAVINALQDDGVLFGEAEREFFIPLLVETTGIIDRASLSGLLIIQTNAERETLLKQLAQDTLATSAKVSRLAQTHTLETSAKVLKSAQIRNPQYDERNVARQFEYYLNLFDYL
ncbi:unnamed protein product [Didymodactylos carnosus]|uniref:Uncharacterized protein n=1 Tax=Didymodactylos carnosus TaxID=1234261 RepID=A0A814LWG6_9BILA|nr:unnamed protein product [Didymodactylos carnosus]CAF1070568.1 unnamed protein product [Didymodactylos carnosus]CAF3581569.1 unnamed protein product [Didymodactylos carnosus]CAF3837742.1 unnamed protein product [Didymodactylos carnosus]